MPSLVRAAAQPATTRAAMGAAIGTCFGLYLLLGVSAALLLGRHTAPLITLNFDDFRGGAPAGAPVPLWALLVSRWVMVLPLLTTSAAFPLFNAVLASNLVEVALPRPKPSPNPEPEPEPEPKPGPEAESEADLEPEPEPEPEP